jgi:hypothetical protein
MKDKIKEKLLKGCGKSFKNWLNERFSTLCLIDNPTEEDIKKDKKIQKEHDKQFICGNNKLCPKCKSKLEQHEETKGWFIELINEQIKIQEKFLGKGFDKSVQWRVIGFEELLKRIENSQKLSTTEDQE